MVYGLYVVTDEEISGLPHSLIAKLALKGGADVIQLRDKKRSARELFSIAKEIKELTLHYGGLFIVNDRLDLAIAANADGVHLGQNDLPLYAARKIAPGPFIVGISVSSVEQAVLAEKEGADYIAVSPVFSTPTKPDAGCGVGLTVVQEIKSAVSVPIIGIGGINANNIHEVIDAGANGVAVISAVVCSEDITGSVRELKKILFQLKNR